MFGRKLNRRVFGRGLVVRLPALMALCVVVLGLGLGLVPEAEGRMTPRMREVARRRTYLRTLETDRVRLSNAIVSKEEELRTLSRVGLSSAVLAERQGNLRGQLQALRATLADREEQLRNLNRYIVQEEANVRFWENFRGEHGPRRQQMAVAEARRRGWVMGDNDRPLPDGPQQDDPPNAVAAGDRLDAGTQTSTVQ